MNDILKNEKEKGENMTWKQMKEKIEAEKQYQKTVEKIHTAKDVNITKEEIDQERKYEYRKNRKKS